MGHLDLEDLFDPEEIEQRRLEREAEDERAWAQAQSVPPERRTTILPDGRVLDGNGKEVRIGP